MTSELKLRTARSELLQEYTFYGYLAMKLELEENNDLPSPTIATDGETLYYDRKFIEQVDFDELKYFILPHELWHIILEHTGEKRMKERTPARWYRACDYAVNCKLKRAGIKLPDYAFYNKRFENLVAERIYDMLPEDKTSFFDAVLEGKTSKVDWREAILEAGAIARMRGNLSQDIEESINELLKPKIDWKIRLLKYVEQLIKGNYSYSKPNKKYTDVIFPSFC